MNLVERLYSYAEAVLDGNIPACKKHIWACERFMRDVESLESDACHFEFDPDELDQFYEWAKMFKHREGVLAGEPIELTDFQLFIAGNIFCWKYKTTGYRRFRKAFVELARKNAKSELLALIMTYASFLSDEREEGYIGGWDRQQSSIVYKQILGQIETCELLKGKYENTYGEITHLKSGSVIQPLSKEARKTGDGKNPSIAVIDEYHAHETSEIYDVLASGMAARRNPLIFIITTAGFDLSRPCFTEYQYVSNILDPNSPIENDEYFVMICELDKEDDIKDERVWIKANPLVATYEVGLNYLRGELKSALDVPEKMRNFLTKNMNMWVDQRENGYMDMAKWRACGAKVVPDLSGATSLVGVDLSMTTDITSVGSVYVLEDGRFFVRQHSFMPEDRFAERLKTDKVPYDVWKSQGWLSVTPGAVVDYAFVEEYIKGLRENGQHIQEIDYDKWNATHFAQDMESAGFLTVEIPQSIRFLSEPTKRFRTEVYQGKVLHENDPLLTWTINNAVTKVDAQENIMLDKAKSKQRIDPIAAVINAFSRAMVHETKTSVYERRGMRRL